MMKVTEEMINRAEDLYSDFYREYEYIGIRVQEEEFELGKIDHISHVWVNGTDTGVELPGLCVLSADHARLATQYFGDHVAIIGGNRFEYGEDEGELIISDPVVLEVLA